MRESGPQVSDGTTLEEVHVHRGHFNRSLLGGRFPPALEVRGQSEPREVWQHSAECVCVAQERIFLAFRSKNREVVTFRASPLRPLRPV